VLEPGALPATLRIEIAGATREWSLGAARYYSPQQAAAHRYWRGWHPPPTERHALFTALWRLLRHMGASEREAVLAELRRWRGGAACPRPDRRSVTAGEVVALAEGHLIEIGCHTRTHAALTEQSPALRESEVHGAKVTLESLLSGPITSFAYPFGDYDDPSAAAVRDAGFACAVTTDQTLVAPHCDRFRLPRIAAEDWDGEEFERRLTEGFAPAVPGS
jgi:peptidoglycan/xylan/chitin deacetylase (PgdA/CDA1 family)